MRPLRSLPLASLLLLGCSDPTRVDWDLDELEVTTSVSSTTVAELRPILITVTVTNVGQEPRGLIDRCVQPFVVTNAEGEQVGPPEVYCLVAAAAAPSGAQSAQLAPGESRTFEHYWNGGRYQPSPMESRLLPPGTYYVRGQVWPMPKISGDEPEGAVRLRPALGDPVAVTMLPPP